jgi:hypothetical protein
MMAGRGINWREARIVAQDRNRWRRLCRSLNTVRKKTMNNNNNNKIMKRRYAAGLPLLSSWDVDFVDFLGELCQQLLLVKQGF